MEKGGRGNMRERGGKTMSRREFLRKTGEAVTAVAGTVTLASVLGPLAWEWGQNEWNSEELNTQITTLKKQILERYGVRATVSPGEYPHEERVRHETLFTSEIASLYLQFKSLEIIRNTLSIYPPDLIREYIREIRVVDDAKSHDFKVDERVVGTVDYEKRLVVLSLMPIIKAHLAIVGNSPSPETIHHEIAHLICEKVPAEHWKALHPEVKYLGPLASLLPEN